MDIIDRMAALSLDNQSELRIRLQGYYLRLGQNKSYYLLRNGYICIKDIDNKKFIMLERLFDENKLHILCHKCMDVKMIRSVRINADIKSCEHSLVCKLLWEESELTNDTEGTSSDNTEVGHIQVIEDQENKLFMAVVYPPSSSNKPPAPVYVNNHTSRPLCAICKGRDQCIHLSIYRQCWNCLLYTSAAADE